MFVVPESSCAFIPIAEKN